MTSKMREIEKREGRPIRDVLSELFAAHQSQAGVASELGITQSTLSYWLLKLGLEQRTILVEKESA